MKCKYARKMFVDYIDESLKPEENRVLQEHIASCHFCLQKLEVMRKTLKLIKVLKVEYPPDHVWNNFLPDLHRRIESEAVLAFKKHQRQRFYLLPGWAASIATVILIIFVSVFLTYHPAPDSIRLRESKITEMVSNASSNAMKYSSEPMLIADIISDILITETEAVELKRINDFNQPESLYYYEDIMNDVLVELSNTKDNTELIQFLLNEGFEEFDDGQMIDPHVSDSGPM